MSKDKMIRDERLGMTKTHELIRAHDELIGIEPLHEFCAERNFGYGIYEDGSLYISDYTEDPFGRWWGRIFKGGTAEVYMFMESQKEDRVFLKNILTDLKEINENYFNENK